MDSRSFMRRQFSLNGRALELRAIHSVHVWRVAVFENGIPVSGDIGRLSERDIEAAGGRPGKDLLEDMLVEFQHAIEQGKLLVPPVH